MDESFATARRVAADYLQRGWHVVPIPYRAKSPALKRWQHLRITVPELPRYFPARPINIGVLLGAPSGWLIDVDLDHLRALEIAPKYLPVTGAVFGRRGKPSSHWVYQSSAPVPTRQWRIGKKAMIVELRSTGSQTVFPGSVHESGEAIQWEFDGEPAEIDPDVLTAGLDALYHEVRRRLEITGTIKKASRMADIRDAPTTIVARARNYLAKLPIAISGQGGHNATYHAACTLVLGFGLDREQSLALLAEWNSRCQPPWSEKELEHKVEDALKEPGWRGYLLGRGEQRPVCSPYSPIIERANRHAIAHRRMERRRLRA